MNMQTASIHHRFFPSRGEAKGYSNSTTLAQDVRSAEEANRILLALSDSVAARMRADGVRGVLRLRHDPCQ